MCERAEKGRLLMGKLYCCDPSLWGASALPVVDRFGHSLNPTGVIRRIHGDQFLGQTVEQLDVVFELVQLGVERLREMKRYCLH